jgi:hypothetical protein
LFDKFCLTFSLSSLIFVSRFTLTVEGVTPNFHSSGLDLILIDACLFANPGKQICSDFLLKLERARDFDSKQRGGLGIIDL